MLMGETSGNVMDSHEGTKNCKLRNWGARKNKEIP
jgi:hypothetical protein